MQLEAKKTATFPPSFQPPRTLSATFLRPNAYFLLVPFTFFCFPRQIDCDDVTRGDSEPSLEQARPLATSVELFLRLAAFLAEVLSTPARLRDAFPDRTTFRHDSTNPLAYHPFQIPCTLFSDLFPGLRSR